MGFKKIWKTRTWSSVLPVVPGASRLQEGEQSCGVGNKTQVWGAVYLCLTFRTVDRQGLMGWGDWELPTVPGTSKTPGIVVCGTGNGAQGMECSLPGWMYFLVSWHASIFFYLLLCKIYFQIWCATVLYKCRLVYLLIRGLETLIACHHCFFL